MISLTRVMAFNKESRWLVARVWNKIILIITQSSKRLATHLQSFIDTYGIISSISCEAEATILLSKLICYRGCYEEYMKDEEVAYDRLII